MILGQVPKTTATLHKIPDGAAGIKATLEIMAELARRGRETWTVRSLAERIVSNVPQKNYWAELSAIHAWVRDNIRYTHDVRDVETVAPPEQTIQRGLGDCDDKSLLVAALIEAIGHQARFVAVGKRFGDYQHVLVEANIDGAWIPVETTENVPLGWYPPKTNHRLVVDI